MKDMMSLMKQAKDMQKNMAKVQAELAAEEVIGTAGGGLVEVTMTGAQELKGIKIGKDAVDPEDIETLEDLVQAAVADAQRRAQDLAQSRMQSVTGGLQLPGM